MATSLSKTAAPVIGGIRLPTPFLQAPMAGFANRAFRDIVREFGGCGLPAFEMVSAAALVLGREISDRLWGIEDEPRPFAVQIWDRDEHRLAECARRVADMGAPIIDINFGCPAGKILRQRSGAWLLCDPAGVGRMVAAVVRAVKVPVTAKIRLGLSGDSITALDVARCVEDAGAAALAVHGRTADQGFSGEADWNRIAETASAVRIPVIGNGDIDSPARAVERLKTPGIAGVMIGRVAISRPWIFAQAEALRSGLPLPPDPSPAQQRDLLLRHFAKLAGRFGEDGGVVIMRRFACKFAAGLPGAKAFRKAANEARTAAEMAMAIKTRFPGAGTGAAAET
ncbi:MAG: tRNA dihydrouridine synthase DusB [Planctomycetota bacterium]|nr:tRNA dihydrouridine synthase DusB [Planctomycetota bacterium]